jgi:hypothetical protein
MECVRSKTPCDRLPKSFVSRGWVTGKRCTLTPLTVSVPGVSSFFQVT